MVENEDIEDQGCAALMEGLRAAERMRLSILHMEKVGMGDKGMKALARAVHAGNFVEKLHCIETKCDNWVDSDNEEEVEAARSIMTVSDEGVRAALVALARAFDPYFEWAWIRG